MKPLVLIVHGAGHLEVLERSSHHGVASRQPSRAELRDKLDIEVRPAIFLCSLEQVEVRAKHSMSGEFRPLPLRDRHTRVNPCKPRVNGLHAVMLLQQIPSALNWR